MTRPISEPSFPKKIAVNRWQNKENRQKPLASHWVTPDCGALSLAAGECFGDEPGLQNNWAQPPSGIEPFSFRLHMDGSLDFKGHLDASGGAVSGSVAVTIPGANEGDTDYLSGMNGDQYASTVITPDSGATFQIAMVFLDSTSGDLTITWPAA